MTPQSDPAAVPPLARGLLWINGLFLVSYGAWCVFVPGTVTQVTGVVLPGPDAMTEARALYGGMELALGLLMLRGLKLPHFETARMVSIAFFGGLGLARALGMVLDGSLGAYTVVAAIWEIGCAVAFVVLGPLQGSQA